MDCGNRNINKAKANLGYLANKKYKWDYSLARKQCVGFICKQQYVTIKSACLTPQYLIDTLLHHYVTVLIQYIKYHLLGNEPDCL